jgi:hypothetical protein
VPTPLLDNRQLGSDTARANLLTNGGFEIWQRGTVFTGPSASYTADRWGIAIGAGCSINVARDTANVEPGSTYNVGIAHTKGTGNSYLYQDIKFSDFANLKGKTVTFSVRAKTTVAAALSVLIVDGVSNSAASYHSGSGLYETLSVTYTVAATATYLGVWIYMGASGNYYADNAMLVVGAQPADYAPLHPADDLARCQRYYSKVGLSLRYYAQNVAGQQVAETVVAFPAEMPVSPTTTLTPGAVRSNAGTTTADVRSVRHLRFLLYPTAYGLDTYVFDDLLTLEANP